MKNEESLHNENLGYLGWVVNEIIGIGIVNARGVAVGRKSVAVG